MTAIAKIYVNLIRNNSFDIAKVPARWASEVKDYLADYSDEEETTDSNDESDEEDT
jgi:hypothetical protein